MENIKELTKEQQLQLKKVYRKSIFKGLFVGLNYGALIFVANIVITLAKMTFFNSSEIFYGILLFIADFMLIRMMFAATRKDNLLLREEANKILENK